MIRAASGGAPIAGRAGCSVRASAACTPPLLPPTSATRWTSWPASSAADSKRRATARAGCLRRRARRCTTAAMAM
eukprot:4875459-Prymnesium_polylepis.2